MSSVVAPISMARVASAISSVTSGPTMCTPSTSSVFASATIFTKPSVSIRLIARPEAAKGNCPP